MWNEATTNLFWQLCLHANTLELKVEYKICIHSLHRSSAMANEACDIEHICVMFQVMIEGLILLYSSLKGLHKWGTLFLIS